ncbi:Uncharacterized protein TCAP_03411 [Tolypocladium capitatum]|uniref:Uncharacterized protein n=1 Tax=Tolypocladium capitatum TaxID=45235 RepID=A0A2K3QGI8_9HYPO|nr:Uncharacterized protein TCAP_03411 [Tolypocladium capitatum]
MSAIFRQVIERRLEHHRQLQLQPLPKPRPQPQSHSERRRHRHLHHHHARHRHYARHRSRHRSRSRHQRSPLQQTHEPPVGEPKIVRERRKGNIYLTKQFEPCDEALWEKEVVVHIVLQKVVRSSAASLISYKRRSRTIVTCHPALIWRPLRIRGPYASLDLDTLDNLKTTLRTWVCKLHRRGVLFPIMEHNVFLTAKKPNRSVLFLGHLQFCTLRDVWVPSEWDRQLQVQLGEIELLFEPLEAIARSKLGGDAGDGHNAAEEAVTGGKPDEGANTGETG